jgi:hypothetical protein
MCVAPIARLLCEEGVRHGKGETIFGAHPCRFRERRGFDIDREIWPELDESETLHLKSDNVVVQNGTRRAWRNRGTKTATIVLKGAKALRHPCGSRWGFLATVGLWYAAEVGDACQGASLLLRFRNRSSNNRRDRSDAGIAMAQTIKKRVRIMKKGSMAGEIPVLLTK